MSRHRTFQQEASNNEPVDFVCTLKDAINPGIPVSALGRIFLDKAISTVDLHGLVDDVVNHLRAPHFNDGAFDRILLNRLAHFLHGIRARLVHFAQRHIHHANRAIHHCLSGVDAHGHVRQFFPNQTEVGNHFVKRLPLLGISNGVFQRDSRTADTHRAQLEAPDV